MKWHWCTNKGEPSDVETNFQMDTVGNILQISGGIKTKACQNCKKDFAPKVVIDELRQKYDSFKCKDCDFESPVAQDALFHTLDNKDHELKKKKGKRVVGYRKTLDGSAIVEKLENDYLILCKICNDINRI